MMMVLGMFIFSLPTIAYQTLKRSTEWRHGSNSRMGARPAYQFIGPGDDTITLSGWVAPELIGSTGPLKLLRRMADTGKAFILIDGSGKIYGAYVILDMSEDESLFYINGQPRRTDFSFTLRCVDDSMARGLLDDLQLPTSVMSGSPVDWSIA